MRKAISAGIDPQAVHRSRPKTPAREGSNSNGELHLDTPIFRSLLDSLEVGVAIAERSGKLLYANPRFAELLTGSANEDVSGTELKNFVLSTSWDQLSDALSQGTQHHAEGEMVVLGTEGNRTVHLSFSPAPQAAVNAVRLVATEVTELVAANLALKQSELSLQNMSTRLLQVQDEERRKMARDLHDVTGQELAACVMALDNVKNLADKPGADLQKAICESVELLRKVDGEIRTLSYLLHPPLLDEMGLSSALQWYIDGFVKRTGIGVKTELQEKLPRFAIEMEIAMFRVVQEALTNIFRHSGSQRAWVRVSAGQSQLEASIEDEGKGIDKRKVGEKSTKAGVGIQSMRERLRPFDGTLEISSGRRGTKILATIPLIKEARTFSSQPATLKMNFEPEERGAPAAGSSAKRILIADDHEVARKGIRVLLKDQEDLEICGEAKDGLDAVQKVRELVPDLVIMDLSMPHLNGFSALKEIRAAGFSPKVLVYTTHSYPDLQRVAQAAGCDGFVLKSNASHDLIRGVRTVLNGGKFYKEEEPLNAASVSA